MSIYWVSLRIRTPFTQCLVFVFYLFLEMFPILAWRLCYPEAFCPFFIFDKITVETSNGVTWFAIDLNLTFLFSRVQTVLNSSFTLSIPSCCIPASIYLFRVVSRNTRTMYKIYVKLTIKTPVRRPCQYRRSGVFVVNSEHISHIVLVFFLLILNQ